MPFLKTPQDRSWLADYRTYSCVLGKRVRWTQGATEYCGIAEEIDGDGALTVRLDNRELVRIYMGEISLLSETPWEL